MDREEDEDQEQDQEQEQEDHELQEQEDQFILHWNEYLIAAFLGIPETDIQQTLLESQQQISGTIHYLEHDDDTQRPSKRQHLSLPPTNVPKRITRYRHLVLSSHEYHFDDDEGKDILLTPAMEPNLFLRKLIGRIPSTIEGRLTFLGRFMKEADNQVIAVDEIETDEIIPSTEQFSVTTLFTNLKEQLYTAYLMEMRLRRAFRNVLQRWRVYHIRKKDTTRMDPITLSEPKKAVEVYHMALKTRYSFEASSLARWMESNLTYAEGGFAIPMSPRNPWTNIEFTYPELVSIYNQLKEHGELQWAFLTFREHQFHKAKWQRYHGSALTMNAIRNSLAQLDSQYAREMLEDFIFLKMEDLDLYPPPWIQRAYRRAIIHCPRHWYLEEFKAVAFQHYESVHFGQNHRRAIHNRCDRIFRKQDQFIEDLYARGILLSLS